MIKISRRTFVEGAGVGMVATGAQPLAKNKYKAPFTKAVVKGNLIALANA